MGLSQLMKDARERAGLPLTRPVSQVMEDAATARLLRVSEENKKECLRTGESEDARVLRVSEEHRRARAAQKEVEDRILTEARLAAKGWPPSLIKAHSDPYLYFLEMKNGQVIEFSQAEETAAPDFVHLVLSEKHFEYRHRGMDVRLSEIMFCADSGD